MVQQPLVGQSYRGFTITLRQTILDRTPLVERSAQRINLYLTHTHNIHKRQTSMLPAKFEPTIPASDRPQTHALYRAATENGLLYEIHVCCPHCSCEIPNLSNTGLELPGYSL